jgi:HD-GYP domain-containing protein (c-di-GMP phosphodiesterase class II)
VLTEIDERRIDILDLRVGMFVCRLDRPWEGTPFPLQGVEVRSDDDIRALRELCQFVFIDAHREVVDTRALALTRASLSASRFKTGIVHKDKANVVEEVPRAHKALENASQMVDRIYSDIASGRELSVEYVEQAVRPLVASVLRNADAFLYVEGLRRHDSYSYSHSISCSALAAAFGRHMGFAEETIISLAAGGLLMDVGKTQLPEGLLQYKGSLSADAVAVVRSHVAHGLAILGRSSITDPDVVDIVSTHHERHDGSGYPAGMTDTDIPIAGRMLGIIDTYDAMSSVRPYRPAISRHQALQHMYAARGTLYQPELVEQFQVCLGVYPTGSLVELNSGEVAVVMAQNQVRRLRPKVLVLSTPAKQALTDFRILDLMDQGDPASVVEIARSLAPGEFAVDVTEHFLH